MKEKESLLKKEFKYKDVQRARNLIKKDYHAKTIEGVGYQKAFEERKEGDVWEEDGKTWTIKNGLKQTVSKLDSIRKKVTKPLLCPSCNGVLNYHLHTKMWKIHGMCFDCVIDMEAGLRKLGKYEQYERAMMTGNLQVWATDMKAYLTEELDQRTSVVTEDGVVEDWHSNSNIQKQKVLDAMDEYIKEVQKAQEKLTSED